MSEIAYSIHPYPGETDDCHVWTATESGNIIGELYADLHTGQIMQIEVDTDRRGEGIATAMYNAASAQITLYHSPDEHCTPEGLAFKQAVGGATVPDELAYTPEFAPYDPSEI